MSKSVKLCIAWLIGAVVGALLFMATTSTYETGYEYVPPEHFVDDPRTWDWGVV